MLNREYKNQCSDSDTVPFWTTMNIHYSSAQPSANQKEGRVRQVEKTAEE